jgi:hypothetical protein
MASVRKFKVPNLCSFEANVIVLAGKGRILLEPETLHPNSIGKCDPGMSVSIPVSF